MRSRAEIRSDLIKALKEQMLNSLSGAKQQVPDYEEYFNQNIDPWKTPFSKQVVEVLNTIDRAARKIADLWLGPEAPAEEPTEAKPVKSSRRSIKSSTRPDFDYAGAAREVAKVRGGDYVDWEDFGDGTVGVIVDYGEDDGPVEHLFTYDQLRDYLPKRAVSSSRKTVKKYVAKRETKR